MHLGMLTGWRIASLPLAALLCAIPAAAEDKKTEKENNPPAATDKGASTAPVGSSGLVAFRDPQTGELRAPTAEEYQRAFGSSGSAARPSGAPQAGVRRDGVGWAVVAPRYMEMLLAKRTADGTIIFGHASDAEEAEEFFSREEERNDR